MNNFDELMDRTHQAAYDNGFHEGMEKAAQIISDIHDQLKEKRKINRAKLQLALDEKTMPWRDDEEIKQAMEHGFDLDSSEVDGCREAYEALTQELRTLAKIKIKNYADNFRETEGVTA